MTFDEWWIENSSGVCAGMRWTDNAQRAKVLDIARCAWEAAWEYWDRREGEDEDAEGDL